MPDALSRLPWEVRQWIEVIGMDATLALVRRWKFQRLYLPAKIAADHPVAAAIGQDAAQRLADWVRAERFRDYIEPPGCAAALRQARDAAILAAAQEATTNGLAAQFDVSRRTVFNAKARAKQAPAPATPIADLFADL